MPQDRTITPAPATSTRPGGDIVRQGEIHDFYFDIDGVGRELLTGTFIVLQYPGDTPTVTGSLTYLDGQYKGTLSATDTAGLAVGQWWVYAEFVDSDEDTHVPLKVYIAKGWA